MIELSEEDFTVSQAYKECQEDWQANEFEIIEIENYLNKEGE